MTTQLKTIKFNPFNYFDTDEEVLDYLSDCLNDDSKLFIGALIHLIDKKGTHQVAQMTGLSYEHLSNIINGNNEPTWDMIHKILHAFKFNINLVPAHA